MWKAQNIVLYTHSKYTYRILVSFFPTVKSISKPWLPQTRTKLLAKNEVTDIAKNYRPITCLNPMYKIYTSDYCYKSQTISPEQAAGRKGVWGCSEQLLINKTIMTEVRKKRGNLFIIWLDDKKAFDSVPHDWLIYTLKLIKVPLPLIRQ